MISFFLEIYSALIITVLLLFYLLEKQRPPKFNKPLFRWLLTHLALLITDGCVYLFPAGTAAAGVLLVAARILFFAGLILFGQFLCSYIKLERSLALKIMTAPAVLCCGISVFWAVDVFCGLGLLTVPGNAAYSNGPLYSVHLGVAALILIASIIPAFRDLERLRERDVISLYSYSLLSAVTLPFTARGSMTPVLLAQTVSVVILYLMIYAEQSRLLHEQKAEFLHQKAELADSRRKIMLSQIQPHFLYNALNSIYYLCGKDSELAQRAISHFSDYLRVNLDSLSRENIIPFETELQHVETYLWLEKLRFDDDLTVVLNIPKQNFMIPALSVQPLAENAVKHGICKKEGGGTLTITTGEDADCYFVSVADDGVGFDPRKVLNDGRTHIGVESVSDRVQALCGGTLDIQSEPGKGTVSTIRIPKKREEDK